MKIFTCDQAREIEENAFKAGMSYITMMENAGKACSEKIEKIVKKTNISVSSICILCGSGKNAGDGFVIARYLSQKGFGVKVVLLSGMPKASESVEMYGKIRALPVKIIDAAASNQEWVNAIFSSELVIDCIFGIGFKGKVNGRLAHIINDINSMKKAVVSIDVPSGLAGDTGEINSAFIKADYTLAISCKKPVHVLKPAAEKCGRVTVVDIGFSKDCYSLASDCAFRCADTSFVSNTMPKRKSNSNKGSYGRLLNVCGSQRMQGAAALCSLAAVKSGAGLVTSAFPKKAYCAIAPKLTEPLMLPLSDDEKGFLSIESLPEILESLKKSDACVIGCGLGLTDDTKKIIYSVVKNATCPLIVDADGINALSLNINVLKEARAPVIITPHPGEMSRLCGMSVEEIQNNRIAVAKSFAQISGAVVVLKGSNTVIATPDSMVCVNPTGNAGLAKGGSGDMLAGMIGAFCAQGMSAANAAICAAFAHGMCADELAKKYSMQGLTPLMMIDYLPKLLSKFEKLD